VLLDFPARDELLARHDRIRLQPLRYLEQVGRTDRSRLVQLRLRSLLVELPRDLKAGEEERAATTATAADAREKERERERRERKRRDSEIENSQQG
jgi:hypothetical protein